MIEGEKEIPCKHSLLSGIGDHAAGPVQRNGITTLLFSAENNTYVVVIM